MTLPSHNGPYQPYPPQPQWRPGPGQTSGYQVPPTYGSPADGPPPPAPKRRKKWPWIVGGILALFVLIGLVSPKTPAPTTAASPSAVGASPAAAVPAAPAAPSGTSKYGPIAAKYGDQVDVGGLVVTAAKPKAITKAYLGTQWCSRVTYTNKGESSESYNLFDWNLKTKNGTENSASLPFNAGGDALNSGDLSPGGNVSGLICGDSHTKDVVGIVYKPGFGILHQVTFS